MLVLLDCNVWLDAVSASQGIPDETALKRSELGKILLAALKQRRVDGDPIRVAVSRHVLLTCDHVAALRGWAEAGETQRWIAGLIGRLIERGSAVFDNTIEDYSALSARAAQIDGAEDAEDEAVLRGTLAAGAVLVTNDWDLSGVAGRRGCKVMGSRELVRRLG